MKHYRDAETGRYISAEKAKMLDKSTYVVEEDAETDNSQLLTDVYLQIMKELRFSYDIRGGLIPANAIKQVFREYGIEI